MAEGTRILALLGGAAALFAGGFWLGNDLAGAKGEAAVQALRVEREEERRQSSEAYGRALADALEQYENEAARANAVAAAFAESKKAHAKEAEALQRRIAHAVRNSAHTFSPDFVRLYNEAIGIPQDAVSEAVCPRGSSGGAGTGPAVDKGLLERLSGVSEADLLAHIAAYGRRCRGLEAQVRGWQALQRSWK